MRLEQIALELNRKTQQLPPHRHKRLKEAIKAIHTRGEYPSARKINLQLKRKGYSLNGSECISRRLIFKELGIKLLRVGWADIDSEFLW